MESGAVGGGGIGAGEEGEIADWVENGCVGGNVAGGGAVGGC